MRTVNQVLRTLKTHREKLRGFGAQRLALFGSVACGQGRDQSDLDFLVEFEEKSFDHYMGLKIFLEELFNCRVDLVIPTTLKPRLRKRILSEVVDVPGL